MLDPLIDGEDRDIAGPREPAGAQEQLQVAQDVGAAVGADPNAIHEIWAGQVKAFLGNLGVMVKQRLRFGAEQVFDFTEVHDDVPDEKWATRGIIRRCGLRAQIGEFATFPSKRLAFSISTYDT